MNEVTLKHCPFCGGEVTETRGQINAPFYFYKCKSKKCGAVVSFDNMPANLVPIKARENWNRRAPCALHRSAAGAPEGGSMSVAIRPIGGLIKRVH